MKAIIFARVSSKDQEEGHSIPSQTRRLTEYAQKKNFIIASTYQVTESSSKETRKQFEQIIHFVKKSKEPYALVTDTVDRLQRSFRETPLLDELRKQGKLELHFLREGLIVDQTSNSSQLMQWDIGVLFASSYVRQLGDNVKRSQEQCIRNGQWIFLAPYGYKNVSLSSGEKTIEVDEEQAACVRKIFELYSKGNNSFQTIAEQLNAQGWAKSSRGKKIIARTVELTLKNHFYMGVMYIKGQMYPHKYPPLVSEELFNRVQDIIAGHHKAPVKYMSRKPILLRGLITCARCDGTVSGDMKKQKYTYYSCHNSKRICTKKWVKEEALLKELLSHFDAIRLSDEQIKDIIGYIGEHEAQEQESLKRVKQQLTSRLDLTQERISKLTDMHVDGKIDSQIYNMKIEEYKREQQNMMSQLKSYSDENKNDLAIAQEVLELAQEAREIFESSKWGEKQQFLGFFFSNLKLNDGKLDVQLRSPFNLMANVSDQHMWRSLITKFRDKDISFDFTLQRIQTALRLLKITL